MQSWCNSRLASIGRLTNTGARTSPEDLELAIGVSQGTAPQDRFPKGFASLAMFISSNANSESFIYKRFDQLAARNLLYLQSELAYLEGKLQEYDAADVDAVGQQGFEARRCARSWEHFERAKESNAAQRERWSTILRIRATLREYRESIPSVQEMQELKFLQKRLC
jgi:hypothetical protein